MIVHKALRLFAAAAALLAVTGCETLNEAWEEALTPSKSTFGEEYQPKYVLALYQVVKYPRAGDLEAEISTFDGKKLWINTNQFFSSKQVKDIKLLPRADRPDCYDIALQLDERGSRIWTMMSLQFRDEPVAMMIDKYFQCTFNPQPLDSDEETWVVIKYPFDQVTAHGLQKYAKQNYKYFNPSPTSLF